MDEKKKPADGGDAMDPRIMNSLLGALEGAMSAWTGSGADNAKRMEMIRVQYHEMRSTISSQMEIIDAYREALTAVVCSENHKEAVAAAKGVLRPPKPKVSVKG